MTTLAIDVTGLTHTYPAIKKSRKRNAAKAGSASASPATGPALDDVSLSVATGETFGLLGPNGSGKTTLFRILATLLRPTQGSAKVFGHGVASDPAGVRKQIGVVFQSPSLDVKLTARENLQHHGRLYGLSGSMLKQRIDESLNAVNLSDRAEDRVETFSGGMKRRVEIAKVMLHEPRLLLLDEPATGLDPAARRDLWQQLNKLKSESGVTIAVTTHLMEEAEHCDRLAIMNAGSLVAVDTPDALKSRIGSDVVTVTPRSGEPIDQLCDDITQTFSPWEDDHAKPRIVDTSIVMQHENGSDFVAQIGSNLPNRLQTITVGRPTLDDVFLQMTGNRLGELGDIDV